MFINLIKIIVSIISTILYLNLVIKFVKRTNQNLLILPISFFYFFFVLPIGLDLIIGRAIPLQRYYGFLISYKDIYTELLYNATVLFNIIVYYKFFNKNVQILDVEIAFKYKNFIFILFIFIDIAITILLFQQLDRDTLHSILTYNTRYLYKDGLLGIISTYSFIIIALNLSSLLLEKKSDLFWIKLLILFPFLFFVCLCNGKKSIVFIVIFILLIIIYINKIIKKTSRYIFLILILSLSLLFYYNKYLSNIVTTRKHETFLDNYYSYRVEFCRDDTLKMVIYDELYNDYKILNYRGESLLFYPTFFIRRVNWENKPYPYATYFTSKLLNLESVRYVGWHMTTSIYDELVSNTGLIALIYIPFLVCFLINKLNTFANSNKLLDLIIRLLGVLLISLYFAVQINALLIINLLFLCLLVLRLVTKKFKIKKRI